jgi:hypothetical protein
VFVDYFTRVAVLAATISIICFSTALSRQWKTTPELSVRDYSGVRQPSGSAGNGTKVLCIAPGLLRPSVPPRGVQCI